MQLTKLQNKQITLNYLNNNNITYYTYNNIITYFSDFVNGQ